MSLQAPAYQQYDERAAIQPPAFYNTVGYWVAPSIPHSYGPPLVPQEGLRQLAVRGYKVPLLQGNSNVPPAALDRQRQWVQASLTGNQSWQYQQLSAPPLPTGGQGVPPARLGAVRAGGR